MRIYTITLNPAYDIYTICGAVTLGAENILENVGKYCGGKGVNISRALLSVGVSSTAVCVLGRENAQEYVDVQTAHGLNLKCYFTDGKIRENITVRSLDTGEETRLCFDGAPLDSSILENIRRDLLAEIGAGDILTFTGSIPRGVEKEDVIRLLTSARMRGARLVIDSRSFTLDDLAEIRPYLIKPNEQELASYASVDTASIRGVASCAERLSALGIENVLVSLGARGAVLATACAVYYAQSPSLSAVSTVGAGDSMIAGFLYSRLNGDDHLGSLRLSVAFGAAACLRPGVEPPMREDIDSLLPLVTVQNLT